jgi:antitoxin component of MazEF toxin-antitoxin module
MQIDSKRVFRVGGSLAIRLPRECAAAIGARLGQPLYVLGMMDGGIRVDGEPNEWATEIRLRVIDNGLPAVAIPAKLARTRGIEVGTHLTIVQDGDGLILRRDEC